MKIIQELRMRRAFDRHKSSGPLPIILGAVIAFGIGLLGISGIVKMSVAPAASTTMAAAVPAGASESKAEVSIPSGSGRTGRAETAPLIKICIPLPRLGISHDQNIGSAEIYRLLWTASSMSRVAAAAGINQKAIDDVEFAAIWAEVADCIYRQNGWVLCDPDNRALAVETTNAFLRQLSVAAKAETPDAKDGARLMRQGMSRDYALQNAQSAKGRVMDGVRHQVSEGRLITSDFGMFAPAEVLQVVRETRVQRDGCANRS
jgi:hypothetical protein